MAGRFDVCVCVCGQHAPRVVVKHLDANNNDASQMMSSEMLANSCLQRVILLVCARSVRTEPETAHRFGGALPWTPEIKSYRVTARGDLAGHSVVYYIYN